MPVGLLSACLPLMFGLLTPDGVFDDTNDGWRPPEHGLAPGVYAHPKHLLVVHRRWVQEWAASGQYAFGWIDGDRLVRTTRRRIPVQGLLPAEQSGEGSTRLVRTARGLCVGADCAIELLHRPANFDEPTAGRVWDHGGWRLASVRGGLVVAMNLGGPMTLALGEHKAREGLTRKRDDPLRPVRIDWPALQATMREPPRSSADGLLRRHSGVYAGSTHSMPAPAPTAIPIRMRRFHVAWRRADGGISLWHPWHAADPIPTPWLVEVPTAAPGTAPPRSPWLEPMRGWPIATPDTIGCRCIRPPCAPSSAPRGDAATQITITGLPFDHVHWYCDRPEAVRRWSLHALGMPGTLRFVRVPQSSMGHMWLEIADRRPLKGHERGLSLKAPELGFEGEAGISVEPQVDGRVRAKVWVWRPVQWSKAPPEQTEVVLQMGLTEALGPLTHRPDGTFWLPPTLGSKRLAPERGGRLTATIDGGIVRAEWIEDELWVQLVREATLSIAP